MQPRFKLLFLALLAGACAAATPAAHAERKTVCTITVNSPNEKDVFRRYLPADQYEFVELVERDRPDWLASACRRGIRCDALVISGHHDSEQGFFSDRVEAGEYLNDAEMERVACSDSCPGLFSQLKEVYLFGCNTLNPEATRSAADEVGRSLVRAGRSRAEAERTVRLLAAVHGDSSRDRMRRVFKDVPAIYGFSSVAPLGPTAAALLGRHLAADGIGEFATGRTSSRLLGRFAGHSMVAVRGYGDADANSAHRRDVCQFSDDRLTPAQRMAFARSLLARGPAEVRMFLDRLEQYAAGLTPQVREDAGVARELDTISRDGAARNRFLAFARDADEPRTRARMTLLAGQLGWLSPTEQHDELRALIDDRLAATVVTPADVDLVCGLNHDGSLSAELRNVEIPQGSAERTGGAALLACLGSATGRSRVLQALTSPVEADVAIAQVFLRHRPIEDVTELRAVIAGVARMTSTDAQIRALESLAALRMSDPASIGELARLYPVAESTGVQTAIAGVLLRSDFDGVDRPELAQTLRDHRLSVAGGGDIIDVLIRRLRTP